MNFAENYLCMALFNQSMILIQTDPNVANDLFMESLNLAQKYNVVEVLNAMEPILKEAGINVDSK
ncbi:hypothetical protein [Methanobrevibacter sp. DSM 116169]|uniref:hypothetical protein n=1 Tax=Methanobrevibacter sp. DSM 116169 TaxID=3242727 RepID=UPI0038FCAF09